MKKTMVYHSYDEDVFVNAHQNRKLKDNFQWVHTNIFYRLCSASLFYLMYFIGVFYCRWILHVQVQNKQVLKQAKHQGIFLYANHTQPFGDVVLPTRVTGLRRIYIVAGVVNLGVPVLGALIPMMGGIMVPDNLEGLCGFQNAIAQRIAERKVVVIYPEAHVWPYYTGIRPYPATSFQFPVAQQAPSFCMTTTYQKRKWGRRPKTTVYVDGPFLPDTTLHKKQQQKKLHDEVYRCMRERAHQSTYTYIEYRKVSPFS